MTTFDRILITLFAAVIALFLISLVGAFTSAAREAHALAHIMQCAPQCTTDTECEALETLDTLDNLGPQEPKP